MCDLYAKLETIETVNHTNTLYIQNVPCVTFKIPYQFSTFVASLLTALRFSIEMENTTAFREVGAKLAMHPPQACRQMELNSDALLDCYIRHVGMTVFHFSSSCRMGPKHDANSVVDAQLRYPVILHCLIDYL